MPSIYEPSEDSYLISETLKIEIPELLTRKPDLRLLEIGCGSGINLETAVKTGVKKENIFGCDINPVAVNHCKSLRFNCIKSDLFSNIKGKFDVIVFNPPYLPKDDREPKDSGLATTAGKKGNEIIVRFLKRAKEHLAENGRIFLITSSLSKKIDFKKLGYKSEKINSKKLFFEELGVWRITQPQ